MSALTYVIQIDGPGALVKIGRSNNPVSRLATLRTGLPWPIRLVALFGRDVEGEMKRQFASDRVQGEWFTPSTALATYLDDAANRGALVKQVKVDQAYVNAVIKPRIIEYLNGREAENNSSGDLVRCIFADALPSLAGRETELVRATKGHVTLPLARGWCPTNEVPVLELPAPAEQTAAAA